MKKITAVYFTIALLLLSFSFIRVNAQISHGGTPKSFILQLRNSYDGVVLQAPNVKALLDEDAANDEKGEAFRISKNIHLDANMQNSGTWEELDNGDRIWRFRIYAEGAFGLKVLYNAFSLPEGSSLFLYNDDKTDVIGSFNYTNNPKREEWSTQFTSGDAVTLEYYEPKDVAGAPIIEIADVSYGYKDIPMFRANTNYKVGESEACMINVACPEGDNWRDEEKGVVKITIVLGGSGYLCSGSLINNTRQDCRPYFLTAYHCGGEATAAEFNQWTFRFHYKSTQCDVNNGGSSKVTTGATYRAGGANSYGSGSDMLLLELNNLPTSTAQNWNVYYNGWNRGSSTSSSGVGIHQPAGDIMKISTYTTNLINSYGTHWAVQWKPTVTGHSVTEGGSSGSPIFNAAGLIVGTLTGGGSFCNTPYDYDYYGKMFYHWDKNGATAATQCKPWLDPNNTGVTTLNGSYAPCSGNVVDFSANQQTVLAGGWVNFTSLCGVNVSQFDWSFTGPEIITSDVENPAVKFTMPGTYTVKLIGYDGTLVDFEEKSAYIIVVDTIINCDTISNIDISENIVEPAFTASWGYWTGHNGLNMSQFAEHYTDAYHNQIEGLYFTPFKVVDQSGSAVVLFRIYEDGPVPGNVIAEKSVLYADMVEGEQNYFAFDNVVDFVGGFYAGYEISYSAPLDTFAIYMAENRPAGPNTAFLSFYGNWISFEEFSSGALFSSVAMKPAVCKLYEGPAVAADFTSDVITVHAGESVSFSDLSTGPVIAHNWVFPGGLPSVSIEQNPVVQYDSVGIYDVSLNVSEGIDYDEELKSGYIVVTYPVGTNSLTADEKILVWPNPAKDELLIYSENISIHESAIYLYDLSGRTLPVNTMVKNKIISMDISGIAEGVYMVGLQNGTTVSYSKVIIAR